MSVDRCIQCGLWEDNHLPTCSLYDELDQLKTPEALREWAKRMHAVCAVATESLQTIVDRTEDHWTWWWANRGLGRAVDPVTGPERTKTGEEASERKLITAAQGESLTDEMLTSIRSWLKLAESDPGYLRAGATSPEWYAAMEIVHEYVQNDKKIDRSRHAMFVRALLHEVVRLREFSR